MNDAGKSLEKWYQMGLSRSHRMRFTCEMLRQMVRALNQLHDLGYSHGDIKPENICAKYDDKGELVFTLIDFGVSLRLFEYGQEQNNDIFRGNLNFSSPEHLMNCRASRVDDLYSLLCVAYRFVFHLLPWEEYLKALHKKNPNQPDLFTFEKISEIRFKRIH